jgi:hypothetical protein
MSAPRPQRGRPGRHEQGDEHLWSAPELGRCRTPVLVRDALPHRDRRRDDSVDYVEHRSLGQEARRRVHGSRLARTPRDCARDAATSLGHHGALVASDHLLGRRREVGGAGSIARALVMVGQASMASGLCVACAARRPATYRGPRRRIYASRHPPLVSIYPTRRRPIETA